MDCMQIQRWVTSSSHCQSSGRTMGFYFRKSIGLGPLRFNLSKSGIGVSTGIRGFRVGSGPRGNYVHMGRNGLYYRQTLPTIQPRAVRHTVPRTNAGNEPDPTHGPMSEITSGPVSAMVDSSSAKLLAELNEMSKRFQSLAHPLLRDNHFNALCSFWESYHGGLWQAS